MRRTARSLGISLCVHAAAVLILVFAGTTPRPTPEVFAGYRRITLLMMPAVPMERLVAPRQASRKREPPLTAASALVPTPAPLARRAFAAPPPPVALAKPTAELPAAPTLEVLRNLPAVLKAPLPALPPPPLKTGNLSDATLAPEIASASSVVQAAGFTGVQTATRDAAAARMGIQIPGSFAAVSITRTHAADASVERGSFQDAAFISSSTAALPSSNSTGLSALPIEILYKPRPMYTAEARRLQIEGEVLVELLFAASGEVQMRRVIRGLGHGLDETAADAARAIRFHPASRNGVPVDFTTAVHIIFQLAY